MTHGLARSQVGALLLLILVAGLGGMARADQPYLATAPDLAVLLAPPPPPGSAAQAEELRRLEDIEAARTEAEARAAKADSSRSVFRFADALGPDFREDRLPLSAALFHQVAAETEQIVDHAKGVFVRPRPFSTDPALHPLLGTPADGSRPTGRSPAYPSGHSAFASVTAILLAQAVPERKAAIFGRAQAYANNRLVAGVHYPSDVAAGTISGTVIAAALMEDPRFREDFAKVRAEIRAVLGLDNP
jgi:acid phosphatase (class A)